MCDGSGWTLPTPYWTQTIEVGPNIRIALDSGQDVSVLGEDGKLIAVLVQPDRYRRLVDGPEY